MATVFENYHHGGSLASNHPTAINIYGRVTGAADVNADGYTIQSGRWIKSVTKASEGVMRVTLDRNVTGYVTAWATSSVATMVPCGCTAQSLTAAGGSTFDFTFKVSNSAADPDAAVIGFCITVEA